MTIRRNHNTCHIHCCSDNDRLIGKGSTLLYQNYIHSRYYTVVLITYKTWLKTYVKEKVYRINKNPNNPIKDPIKIVHEGKKIKQIKYVEFMSGATSIF